MTSSFPNQKRKRVSLDIGLSKSCCSYGPAHHSRFHCPSHEYCTPDVGVGGIGGRWYRGLFVCVCVWEGREGGRKKKKKKKKKREGGGYLLGFFGFVQLSFCLHTQQHQHQHHYHPHPPLPQPHLQPAQPAQPAHQPYPHLHTNSPPQNRIF